MGRYVPNQDIVGIHNKWCLDNIYEDDLPRKVIDFSESLSQALK